MIESIDPNAVELDARLMQVDDDDAFARLYHRFAKELHDRFSHATRDRGKAEDLVQATFLRAWERRASLREPALVRSWLHTIATNLIRDDVRRPNTLAKLGDLAAPEGQSPEAQAISTHYARMVWDAADLLDRHHAEVLNLSLRYDMGSEAVAEVLGVARPRGAQLIQRSQEALETAVKVMLVGQRRSECTRLAALLADAEEPLTVKNRKTIDRHMRQCEGCKTLAAKLTHPAALFSALPLLALPKAIEHWHGPASASDAALAAAHDGPRALSVQRLITRRALIAVPLLLLIAIGGGTAIVRRAAPDVQSAKPVTLTPTNSVTFPVATSSAPLSAVATPSPVATPQSPVATPPPTSGEPDYRGLWSQGAALMEKIPYEVKSTTRLPGDVTSFDVTADGPDNFTGIVNFSSALVTYGTVVYRGGVLSYHGTMPRIGNAGTPAQQALMDNGWVNFSSTDPAIAAEILTAVRPYTHSGLAATLAPAGVITQLPGVGFTASRQDVKLQSGAVMVTVFISGAADVVQIDNGSASVLFAKWGVAPVYPI